ncbi:MAG: T9SS C-terminal target domain-containing protein [Calditrichaeota bacterium]|nr:MAG: T9SS C-terminal target domain-containing protein [Calditrichota bacterium]
MKNLVKILSSGVLIAGIAGIASAQTFVAMRVNIEGSQNATNPSAASITSITGTYSSAIQTLTAGPDTPGNSGFNYIESTGDLTFNLSNFGTALIFAPAAFATTFQFDVTIDGGTAQNVTTGPFTIPAATANGQPLPVLMGTLGFVDGVVVVPPPAVDPTPPVLGNPTPALPTVGTPIANGTGVNFTAPGGGTIGGMANTAGNQLIPGGGETMSVTSNSAQVITSSGGNPVDVALIIEVNGCVNPPYFITLNIPQSVLLGLAAAGATNVGVSHANTMYSVANGNLTVNSGALDGTDINGAQVQLTLPSCSPIFVQDANDDPLAIELVDFFASNVTSNSVSLNWTTASETNNNGFIVERKAEEGSYIEIASWETDEELVGAGNSSSTNDYSFTDRTVRANTSYIYRLSDVDIEGNVKVHNKTVEVITSTQIDVIPERYYLAQNHPNPFNPSTSIEFGVKEEGKVTLEIYNVKGQLINTLANTDFQAGNHSVVWNGTDNANKAVSSGIYFYKLSVNDYSEVKKMTFLK